ncbi:MAG: hypothetical protein H0T95_10115 [Chthoniobacterales bacterium]|nr:hypothetical protein [Chthoniobacterales bacterium]
MTQSVFTFVTKVNPERVQDLEIVLHEIAGNLTNHPDLPFTALAQLHFASLVIFHDDHYGPYLVFENNVDGTPEAHLEQLCRIASKGLHRIYAHCLGYDAQGAKDCDGIRAYLQKHLVRPNAYHIGNTGRSAEKIRQESALRDGIEVHLDELVAAASGAPSAGVIRRKIQDFVRALPGSEWATSCEPRMTVLGRFLPSVSLAELALAALLFLPVLLPAVIVFVLVLRQRENSDPVETVVFDREQIQRLASAEDHIVQNHMASLCYVKPGSFRRTTLKLVLYLTNLVARVSTNGKLSGLDSLHFAHWALIDDGRRLLFLTNYDGSWENYLDDFIDKAALGLTGIWSNTLNFPRTRFLVLGGARDEKRFKAIARKTQAYTNVWYSAYPNLTVKGIDNNSAIREDLYRSLGPAETKRWLQRF